MKTAISIPDPLFEAAEQFAQEQGLTRNQLYARAIEQYLKRHRYNGVTEALDDVYAEVDSNIDSAYVKAQAESIDKDEP